MPILTKIVNTIFAPRLRAIEHFRRHPIDVQHQTAIELIRSAAQTTVGLDYGIRASDSIDEFVRKMPLFDYPTYKPYIERTLAGEKSVVWNRPVEWFAKSSGTTGSKSKFIPITRTGLRQCHMKGPCDIMAAYCHLHPDSHVLEGKMMTLGGSKRIEKEGDKMLSGDLSAVLIDNTPIWARGFRVPSTDIALLPDFERKVQLICQTATTENVTSFSGVPSWNLVMLNHILEYTGKSNILEVWPNMELFCHGGMNFGPYRQQYRTIIPSDGMHYLETYNASEGFFALNDTADRDDMLLMLDYGVWYEFLPVDSLGDKSAVVPLEGVRTGINYAMIITSCNGLWRYMIGDTVAFTSIDPYRIKVTGRTCHYINAFGEEIIIDNAEKAIAAASIAADCRINEYTVAPVYMEGHRKGAHEWVIEFETEPHDMAVFAGELDRALQNVNSDYEAKRHGDATLYAPKITPVKRGTFMRWMTLNNKVGGQHKVPRLFNDRTYVDQILELDNQTNLKTE